MRKISTLLLVCATTLSVSAQVKQNNKFPSPESVTFENNGNDLRGFINTNKNQLLSKGGVINEASGNSWGYLQIKNAKVPGVDKKGVLNYYESFDATLALYRARDGAKATWWTREYNQPKAPIFYKKVEGADIQGVENIKCNDVFRELESKKFTILEYSNEIPNTRDFDILLKDYIMVKNGSLKDAGDYKALYDFYNGFLNKFTSTSDPLLENRSFITFVEINKEQYVGYFNIVNGKLAGKLEVIEAEFERDRIKLVNDLFKKLTGGYVYVYGDNQFEMEKIITKRAQQSNIKTDNWKTNTTRKFNDDQGPNS